MEEVKAWLVLLGFISLSAVAIALVASDFKKPSLRKIIAGFVISAPLMIFGPVVAGPVEEKFGGLLQFMLVRVALGIGIIAVGAGAHFFKKRNKMRYGQTEVLFGGASAVKIATGMHPGESLFSQWVALAGAAYVVARGLNNWSEALEEDGERYGHRSLIEHVRSWVFERNAKTAAQVKSAPFVGPKQPILERGDITRVGLGNPQARNLGFQAPEGLGFFIRNSEQRYPTNAHNLRADLVLRYIDGKEIRVDNAPWFKNTAQATSGAFFFDTVTIGMLETAAVVYAIQREQTFYVALYDTVVAVKEGQQIPYGEWTMELKIEGDNCLKSFQGKLQFLPNGASGFTPIDSLSAAAAVR
jgi:hypothetical protein